MSGSLVEEACQAAKETNERRHVRSFFKRLPPGGPFRGLWPRIGLRAHKEIRNMRIGVPKEVKDHEDRVGLVPSSVAELVHHGHQVIVEKGAGLGSGLSDAEYTAAGATLSRRPGSDLFTG